MSKVVITNSTEFEKIIRELEHTIPLIEDSFRLQDRNFSMIDGTDNYRGKCQRVISEKYNDVKKNYVPIQEALTNYVKFLKITLLNYEKFEETMDETINNNLENLNVN